MVLARDERKEEIKHWLRDHTPFSAKNLEVASADASFRRYFRFSDKGKSWIVMDAPPDLEPCEPFVRIARQMKEAGVEVPEILAQDLNKGFLALSDFGDIHFRDELEGPQREGIYDHAISEIVKFQTRLTEMSQTLPVFDTVWQRKELEIFREWCLPECSEQNFAQAITPLVEAVDAIPKAFMHRDFHSRNILIPSPGEIGVIDFQGAMLGPVSYDLVSLLRDCYVDNEEEWISQKTTGFQLNLVHAGALDHKIKDVDFLRWLDLAGLQRHLKCIGIFHRLKIRDGKDGYLKDVPRVKRYVETVLARNPELGAIEKLYKRAKTLA